MSTPDDKIHMVEPNVYADSRTCVFYSNYTAVTMTPDEITVRYAARDLDDASKAFEGARIILSPAHAKRLLAVLANIINIYETNFGPLVLDPIQRLSAEGRKHFKVSDQPPSEKPE